jgi:hypothetical protein
MRSAVLIGLNVCDITESVWLKLETIGGGPMNAFVFEQVSLPDPTMGLDPGESWCLHTWPPEQCFIVAEEIWLRPGGFGYETIGWTLTPPVLPHATPACRFASAGDALASPRPSLL